MSLSIYPAFFIFALVMVVTPGPANLLLMSSGASHGFYKSFPFVIGVTCGKIFLTIGLGVGFLSILNSNALFLQILKLIGTAYICWLSYKLLYLDFNSQNSKFENTTPNFINGLFVHPLNPKGWAMVIAAYTQFTSIGNIQSEISWIMEVIIIASTFFCIQIFSHSLWCWSGDLIFKFLKQKNYLKRVVVATLSLLTVSTVLYSNFFI
tara:strand:- start:4551 stop:5174 length:624 start_codon:yes stop_codon:yes gene_type:complete